MRRPSSWVRILPAAGLLALAACSGSARPSSSAEASATAAVKDFVGGRMDAFPARLDPRYHASWVGVADAQQEVAAITAHFGPCSPSQASVIQRPDAASDQTWVLVSLACPKGVLDAQVNLTKDLTIDAFILTSGGQSVYVDNLGKLMIGGRPAT